MQKVPAGISSDIVTLRGLPRADFKEKKIYFNGNSEKVHVVELDKVVCSDSR